jgi:iron complex outermembrane receptor protein
MITTILAAAMLSCAEPDSTVMLGGVTVVGHSQRDFQMKSSQSGVQINRTYLENHFAGSLMQSLEGIPGVKAMSIGSGQSKPTIRGLGFNRMAVVEDGIKHEGQQWGDDHGLEIDQFAVDRIEISKGPGALLYGSDAIGGVLSLYTNHIPAVHFGGNVTLFTRSNNESIGIAAKVGGRSNRFFYRANITMIDYADYRVPTDSIQYYSYYIRLKNRRLRNTAGTERNGGITLGYAGYNFHTDIKISDAYSKSGFFANAHGLEVRLSDIDYDRSRRDIDLPMQSVNHLKVISHTAWHNERLAIEGNLAFQNNLRKEYSEPVSHGYMPTPGTTMERRFDKSTYTANAGMQLALTEQHSISAGASAEYQYNRRGGWGFIIPDFETLSTGAYALNRFAVKENLILNAGIRYDYVRTHIHSYNDWYRTPTENGDSVFKQRSADIHRNFSSLTWSAGVNYSKGNWVLKANIGKSFRVPIPKELGADGVNYHIFRYEKGNAQLSPEESYQIDAGINWNNGTVNIQIDPYLNYFPNYIYLNPTANYYEGLQMYHYTQARVLRYGFEAQLTYALNRRLEAELKGEYLYAEQLSGEKKGYTLPFSMPWTADAGLKYTFGRAGEGFAAINVHITGTQNEIVPPEKPTKGHCTLNASAGKHFALGATKLKITLQAVNLLNKRYYDHTSYYRLIDVPEPGRNLSLMAGLEF